MKRIIRCTGLLEVLLFAVILTVSTASAETVIVPDNPEKLLSLLDGNEIKDFSAIVTGTEQDASALGITIPTSLDAQERFYILVYGYLISLSNSSIQCVKLFGKEERTFLFMHWGLVDVSYSWSKDGNPMKVKMEFANVSYKRTIPVSMIEPKEKDSPSNIRELTIKRSSGEIKLKDADIIRSSDKEKDDETKFKKLKAK